MVVNDRAEFLTSGLFSVSGLMLSKFTSYRILHWSSLVVYLSTNFREHFTENLKTMWGTSKENQEKKQKKPRHSTIEVPEKEYHLATRLYKCFGDFVVLGHLGWGYFQARSCGPGSHRWPLSYTPWEADLRRLMLLSIAQRCLLCLLH